MTVHLRAARRSDLDAIFALEDTTENAPRWPRDAYSAILDANGPRRCLFVAEAVDNLVGYAVGLVPVRSETAELESVVVASHARRSGIGRALCGAVHDWCRLQGAKEVVLEVRATSVGAIALYAGLGFEEVGCRPGYYVNPADDAIVMRLDLSTASKAAYPAF